MSLDHKMNFVEILYGMQSVQEHKLTIHEKDWLISGLSVFAALSSRYTVVEMWQDGKLIRKYINH